MPKKTTDKPLTDKQERFCQEYILDLNKTQAAIRAGYSESTAGAIGHENLKKPEILARVEELQRERSEALNVDMYFVLSKLVAMANVSPQDYYNDQGELKPYNELTEAQKECISEIEHKKTEHTNTTKYKMWDRHKTLEMIAKHIGFYEKDNEQKTTKLEITRKVIDGNEGD